MSEDFTDIFLSQISMLTDWDVLTLQECFRKLDGENVGTHELFTPPELLGGLRCPAVIVNQKWSGQSKIAGGAARWTAVELGGQLTFISAHVPHKGRIRSSFDGIPGIRKWEAQTTCDLGWRLQCEPVRCDRLFPCGRVDSKTTNAGGHERLTESESASHDGDRTGFDGDEHVDECRHRARAFHKIQLVKSLRLVDTNGFHHDFEKTGNETCAGSGLRLVQDGSQSGACCPFDETENEIHEEEWCEPAWLGARRLMAQNGCRDTDGMGELECDGASAVGNGKDSQKIGNQRDVSDRIGAQIASAEKEENRTTQLHKEESLFFVRGMLVAPLPASVSDEVAQELQMPISPQMLDDVEDRPATLKDPGNPDQIVMQQHSLTHFPSQPLCKMCVESRGRGSPHLEQSKIDAVVPQLQFDYRARLLEYGHALCCCGRQVGA